jgi:hypothetical protein
MNLMSDPKTDPENVVPSKTSLTKAALEKTQPALPREIGGAKGLEPTRYGDWEHKGRCTDF